MQEILWRSQNDAYDKPRLLCDRNVQKETSKFSVLVLRSSIRQKNMPHTRIIPATSWLEYFNVSIDKMFYIQNMQ